MASVVLRSRWEAQSSREERRAGEEPSVLSLCALGRGRHVTPPPSFFLAQTPGSGVTAPLRKRG